jgi:hypothetical protein
VIGLAGVLPARLRVTEQEEAVHEQPQPATKRTFAPRDRSGSPIGGRVGALPCPRPGTALITEAMPARSRGGRTTRQRVSRIVSKAASLATERLVARGLPPLPVTTPHSLRRTYVSIALLANNFDVMWVMSQVGHADSKMTTDVYNQLQERARRQQGEAFDALVQAARERLYGADPDNERPRRSGPSGHASGRERERRRSRTSSTSGATMTKAPDRGRRAPRRLDAKLGLLWATEERSIRTRNRTRAKMGLYALSTTSVEKDERR